MLGEKMAKAMDDSSARGDELVRKQVTKNIRALLLSAPNGLSVAEMQRDYHTMIGKPLPFRELDYRTPLDLLKDLPCVTRPTWENGVMVLRGIPDATTRHIASLVARQKKNSSKRKTRVTRYHPEPDPVVPHFVRLQIKELLRAYPSGLLGSMVCIAFNRRFGRELNFDKLGFKSLGCLLHSVRDIVQIEDMRGGGYRVYSRECRLAATDPGKAPDPGDSISVRTQSAATASQTTVERRNYRHAPAEKTYKKSGETQEEGSVQSIKAKLDSKSGIDERLQEECRQVLARRPNGIWAARFAIEYKKLHSNELNIKKLGFMSTVEFMSAMPDVVRIERPTKVDWLLFEVKEEEEEDHSKSNGEVYEPIEKPKERVPSSHVPGNPLNLPDGVGRGIYFTKIEPPGPPECSYIEVFVTHVIDPHNFWVMMIKNWPQLEALTEEMRQFYSGRESARYMMPEWFISVGQACCALFEDGSWYRGLVVGIQSVHSIEVFYVDYGNTARLPLSSLRVLRKQFIELPAQAIPSKLAHVVPFGGGTEWSPGAIHRFYHLTREYRHLVGIICAVEDEKAAICTQLGSGGTLSLCMCDTNDQVDVHINDDLVEKRYAVAVTPPEQRNDIKSPPPQPTPDLSQLFGGQMNLNSKEPGNYLLAPPTNPSLLPDFPLSIGTAYSPDIASWLNQTAQFTRELTNSYAQPQQVDSGVQLNSPLCDDDLELMEEINQELEVDTPSADEKGLIKRLQLEDGQCFHLINYDKKPYLISAEISALFWDSDLLRSMLRQKKKMVVKVVVSFSENEELFGELIRCGVPGVTDGDQPRSFVTLYELEGLPDILRMFDHPSEELLSGVNGEIECFKREEEGFWFTKQKTEEEEAETGSSSEDPFSETELGIDELQLLLQAMQFRRKRILQGLMSGPTDPADGHVDELNEVEIKIEGLRQEIQHKEQQNSIPMRTQSTAARTP